MIALLCGRVAAVDEGSLVLDVGGVGYLVFCPGRVLSGLAVGAEVRLWIETVVREDEFALYGFRDPAERQWFRHLRRIQGVGARIALALLSAFSVEELAAAVAAGDRTRLARASGVGPRLAARIVGELQARADTLPLPVSISQGHAAPEVEDAVAALLHLGYGRLEAYRAVSRARARTGEGVEVDRLVKEALKELAP